MSDLEYIINKRTETVPGYIYYRERERERERSIRFIRNLSQDPDIIFHLDSWATSLNVHQIVKEKFKLIIPTSSPCSN